MEESITARIKEKIDNKVVIDKLSRTFNVLGDPTRVRIILALSEGEFCVNELSKILGLTHSAVSHQLRALKDLDLVIFRKIGKQVYYSLNDDHIRTLFSEGLKHVIEKIGPVEV